MKTLGRIFIILAVFALAMGIIYIAVNAGSSGSSASAPQFGDRPFPSDGERPAFSDGQRPEFPEGERPEFRGERGGGFGLLFGAIKNIGIVAIVVVLIVVPKSWMDKRRRAAQISSE